MTVPLPEFSIEKLKGIKNSLIGRKEAKLAMSQDPAFVQTLVDCLSGTSPDSIRIEAAHVISSLSYGSQEALSVLLKCNALQTILYSISRTSMDVSPALLAAATRALRALSVAIADQVGPSQWGLKSEFRNDMQALEALDSLFKINALDIYLPLLALQPFGQVQMSITELIASCVRTAEHRTAITDWMPSVDRATELINKSKRGWEADGAKSLGGGWAARILTAVIRNKGSNTKIQEHALSALASLSKDNESVAYALSLLPTLDHQELPTALAQAITLSRSRVVDVQLAACLCAVNIIRATPSHQAHNELSASTIILVLNRLVFPDETINVVNAEMMRTRTKACFILAMLLTDSPDLCTKTFDLGSLDKLAQVIQSVSPVSDPGSTPARVTPPVNTPLLPTDAIRTTSTVEWDEDESEAITTLREAAFTALSALSLFSNTIRDAYPLSIFPNLLACLSTPPPVDAEPGNSHPGQNSKYVGTRYAACQCVRSLSRSVSVLRTSIVDSGIGKAVFSILMGSREVTKDGTVIEREDRRVTRAALYAICNIVTDFSPLKSHFLENGIISRFAELLEDDDVALRVGTLWAIKNILRKSTLQEKREVIRMLGSAKLMEYIQSDNVQIQEQGFHIVANLTENEEGLEFVLQEVDLDNLIRHITDGLETANQDVVLHATRALANIANNSGNHSAFLNNTSTLDAISHCLVNPKADIRRPAVSCALELARRDQALHTELSIAMRRAGIMGALRKIADGVRGSTEDNRDVKEQARQALDYVDFGDSF